MYHPLLPDKPVQRGPLYVLFRYSVPFNYKARFVIVMHRIATKSSTWPHANIKMINYEIFTVPYKCSNKLFTHPKYEIFRLLVSTEIFRLLVSTNKKTEMSKEWGKFTERGGT